MKTVSRILPLIVLLLGIQPISAVIVSGYRIKIAGLGTLVLLGDSHERTTHDRDQYSVIQSFLKLAAQKPNETLLNIETTPTAHRLYLKKEVEPLKERLEETMVLTKLRILISALRNEEGLRGTIQFDASDPRNSSFWYIVRLNHLLPLVSTALERKGRSSSTKDLYSSFKEDHQRIVERFERFITRASNELSSKLYKTIAKELYAAVEKPLLYKKSWMKEISTYTSGKDLKDTSIYTIIYQFAKKHHPQLVKNFSGADASDKIKIANTITTSFFNKIGKPFREEYYLTMANLPWIIDSFNMFLTPRNAKRGIIYAGASHIRQIVRFMKRLQTALGDDGTIRFKQIYSDDKPLSNDTLEKILQLEHEKELKKLRDAAIELAKKQKKQRAYARQLEELKREAKKKR